MASSDPRFESPRALMDALFEEASSQRAYIALAAEVAKALRILPQTTDARKLDRIQGALHDYAVNLLKLRAEGGHVGVDTWSGFRRDIQNRTRASRTVSIEERSSGYWWNFHRRLRHELRNDARFEQCPAGWVLAVPPSRVSNDELPLLDAKRDGTLVRPAELREQIVRALARTQGPVPLPLLRETIWNTLHPPVSRGTAALAPPPLDEPTRDLVDQVLGESSTVVPLMSAEVRASEAEWGASADIEATRLLDALPPRTRALARLHFGTGSPSTLEKTAEAARGYLGQSISRGTVDNEVGTNGRFRQAVRQRAGELKLTTDGECRIFWNAILENL